MAVQPRVVVGGGGNGPRIDFGRRPQPPGPGPNINFGNPPAPTPNVGGFGHMNTGGAGNPFPVGSGGGFVSGTGIPITFGGLFGDFGARQAQAASDAAVKEFGDAVNAPLGPNSARFGQFGAFLNNLAQNPEGFGDLLNRHLTRLAEREAGVRGQQLQALDQTSARTGFGASGSRLGLETSMRGDSARRLGEAELQALMQNALLQQQQRATGVQGALGLTGIDARMQELAAQFAANRERPLTGGGSTGPDGQYDLLNENGEPIQFNPDGTPLTAAQRERQRQQLILYRSGNAPQ